MTQPPITPPLALRAPATAKTLAISQRTLHSLTASGQIPHVRLGNGRRQMILYPVDALQKWLADRIQTTTTEGQP